MELGGAAKIAQLSQAMEAAPRPSRIKERAEKTEKRQAAAERKQIEEAVAKDLRLAGHHVSFAIDEATGQIIARVINNETDEVIREIPPEEMLKIAAKVEELAGVIFDKIL